MQNGSQRDKIGNKRKNIVEYFEEVETRQEYKGYFCSIPEAIRIVVLDIVVNKQGAK